MNRVNDWPERLSETIDRHMHAPFVWGVSDCGILFADVVLALTGTDPLAGMRGYRTRIGALRVLKRNGYASVEALVADRFEQIPLAQAGRGDLGFSEITDALTSPAVITGVLAVSKNEDGPVTFTRALIKTAYRVEINQEAGSGPAATGI